MWKFRPQVCFWCTYGAQISDPWRVQVPTLIPKKSTIHGSVNIPVPWILEVASSFFDTIFCSQYLEFKLPFSCGLPPFRHFGTCLNKHYPTAYKRGTSTKKNISQTDGFWKDIKGKVPWNDSRLNQHVVNIQKLGTFVKQLGNQRSNHPRLKPIEIICKAVPPKKAARGVKYLHAIKKPMAMMRIMQPKTVRIQRRWKRSCREVLTICDKLLSTVTATYELQGIYMNILQPVQDFFHQQ